jgi:integrase/recombinase XerD
VVDRTDLPPWDRAVTRWLSRYRPTTEATYRRGIHRWITWCTAESLDPWTARRGDIEAHLAELARAGLAEATVALTYDAIASLYRHLFEDELLERDPAARVRRPTIHREGQARTFLTPLEFAAFLTTARAMGPDAHAVAAIGGMMGLRSAEMCQLDVSSVATVGGYQVLRFVGKGGKPAAPPMPIPVLRPVLQVLAVRTDGPLLRNQVGCRFDRRSLGRLVARIGDRAGISHGITPHGLRRTFATAGFAKGVSLRDMQLGLRHARPDSTIGYDMDHGALDRHASHEIAAFLSGFAS